VITLRTECSHFFFHPEEKKSKKPPSSSVLVTGNIFFSFSAFFHSRLFFSTFFSRRCASRDVAAFSRRFFALDREKGRELLRGERVDFLTYA